MGRILVDENRHDEILVCENPALRCSGIWMFDPHAFAASKNVLNHLDKAAVIGEMLWRRAGDLPRHRQGGGSARILEIVTTDRALTSASDEAATVLCGYDNALGLDPTYDRYKVALRGGYDKKVQRARPLRPDEAAFVLCGYDNRLWFETRPCFNEAATVCAATTTRR